MNTLQKNSISAVALAMLLSLSGCANLSEKEQNTAIGAGAGGVLTGGSTIGILGGAAAGGFLGHILTDDDK